MRCLRLSVAAPVFGPSYFGSASCVLDADYREGYEYKLLASELVKDVQLYTAF